MIAHAITAPPDLADQVASVRSVFASGRTRATDWRLRQLRGIERLLDEHEDQIAAALAQDLGRERAEAWLGDIASTRGEAEFARKHLRRWMKRKKQRVPLSQLPRLPFGGVGDSGMGSYHGEWGFQALSHRKAVLAKTTKPDLKLLYPPYTDRALKIMRRILG
jgi:aldehyde dehydrogenase (NAD+)